MQIRSLIKLVNGKINNLPNDLNKEISSFKLDSKKIVENDVFICINNGYLYIEDAINNGASIIITDKDIHLETDRCLIVVDDIKNTLLKIVSKIREEYKYIPLIAVTGSVGKTTTKELISNILESNYKVLRNEGNKNNYIGISETMFNLNKEYDFIVLEVGMNHFGEIDEISRAIRPNICVITNIGTSHIGYLGSKNNILKAKMEIVNGMNNGVLIVPYLDKKLKHLKYKNINKCKDIKISKIKINDSLKFILKYHKHKYNINFSIPNRYYISNIMLAFMVSTYFNIDINNIIDKINKFKATKSRMNIIDCHKYKVINDTYNSSYESLKGVIDYLNHTKNNKMVILGDIKELGDYSVKIHKKINKLLKKINKNNILLVGNDTKYINGIHFSNNEDIIKYLDSINLDNYTILIKGSRLMHMEDIVNYLNHQ